MCSNCMSHLIEKFNVYISFLGHTAELTKSDMFIFDTQLQKGQNLKKMP